MVASVFPAQYCRSDVVFIVSEWTRASHEECRWSTEIPVEQARESEQQFSKSCVDRLAVAQTISSLYFNHSSTSHKLIMVCAMLRRPFSTRADQPSSQSSALKSIKSLAPLLDRVLVQRVKAEARTSGGIFLPESAVKELNEATVIAVGPGAMDKDGKRIQPSVSAGDKVLIPQVWQLY